VARLICCSIVGSGGISIVQAFGNDVPGGAAKDKLIARIVVSVSAQAFLGIFAYRLV
jgi:hypothetical protein